MSPFHLSRRFRARYGLPPYMYLELVRVNRAREMLRRGEPISRVAFDTGFSDQSHLTRRFKRVVGVPPGQYAKTYGWRVRVTQWPEARARRDAVFGDGSAGLGTQDSRGRPLQPLTAADAATAR